MRVKAYMAAYYLAQAVYQSYMSLFYRARGWTRRASASFTRSRRPPPSPGNCSLARRQTARASRAAFCARCCFRPRRCCFCRLRARRLRPLCPRGAVRLCLYAGAAHRRRPRPRTSGARGEALRPRAADGGAGLRRRGARLRLFARRFGAGEPGGTRGGGADAGRAVLLLPAWRRKTPAWRSAPAAPAQGAEIAAPAFVHSPRAGDNGLLLRLFPHALSGTARRDGRAAGLGEPRLRPGGNPLFARGRPALRPLGRGGRDGAGYAGAGRALAADGAWGKAHACSWEHRYCTALVTLPFP